MNLKKTRPGENDNVENHKKIDATQARYMEIAGPALDVNNDDNVSASNNTTDVVRVKDTMAMTNIPNSRIAEARNMQKLLQPI